MPEKTQLNQHPVRGYLLIAAAAFCYGASATLGKAAFRGILGQQGATAPLDPLILAQARSSISFLLLAPVLARSLARAVYRRSEPPVAHDGSLDRGVITLRPGK